jgi:tetratricopeptide (TPR) repeat protein
VYAHSKTVIQRVRFVRAGSPFQCNRWHLGLFSFYTHKKKEPYSGLAINLRGLLLWLLACLLCGYIVPVSGLFLVWRRDKALGLSYGEMLLLPWRWNAIEERRAKESVNAGLEAMKATRWNDAEILILSGLQRNPRILAGRSQLAYFYYLTGRWSVGASLLSSGFSSGYPGRPYVEEALSIAQGADDLAICTDWCEQMLTRFGESMPSGDRSWLVIREAEFLFTRENYKELSDFAVSHANQGSAGLREFQVLALLKLGDYTQALSKLELWQSQHPEEAAMIVRLRAQALRRAGRLDDMALQLDRACAMAPRNPSVFLESVTERFEAGEMEPAGNALEQFLILFGFEQNSALIEGSMANFAELKYAEGIDRLLRFARVERLPLKKMLLIKIVFDLTEGDISQSRLLLQECDKLWDLENPRDRFLRDFFKLLVDAATDEGPETRARFESFCNERRLEWGDFSRAARVLAKFNREKAALKLLDAALVRYPSSCHLGTLRKKIQTEFDAKTKAIRTE